MLGTPIHCAALKNQESVFDNLLGTDSVDYLLDHRVSGEALMPAAAFLEIAQAAGLALEPGSFSIDDLLIERGMPLRGVDRIQTVVTPAADGFSIEIASLQSSPGQGPVWVRHVSGRLCRAGGSPGGEDIDLPAIRSRLDAEIDIDAFYRAFSSKGIDYGPAFRGVGRIWRRDDEALGWIRVPEARHREIEEYQCHPSLLDACLQVTLAAWWEERAESEAYLPAEITRYRLSGPIRTPSLWCHARARHVVGRSRVFEVTLFDEAGVPVGSISGLCLRRAQPGTPSRDQDWSRWLYVPTWRLRPGSDRHLQSPTPSELHGRLRSRWPELFDLEGLREYGQGFGELERLSLEYIMASLGELGLPVEVGTHWPRDGLAEAVGIAPQHRRCFGRLLQILAEAGVIAAGEASWRVLRPQKANRPDSLRDRILRRFEPVVGAELALVGRCGESLARLLRGQCDPLELLFPGGDLGDATRLYQESGLSARMNAIVRRAVAEWIEQGPRSDRIRILEIGAGTGATTSALLPHLPAERVHYLFTDLSTIFLRKAEARFARYPFVDFQVLDIEKPPGDQGFVTEQADIVIAANVLHATRDLEQVLCHVRGLLAPGGLLILLEATMPQRWPEITFGLLDGWWRFVDRYRVNQPLVPVRGWLELLASIGFESPEPIRVSAPIPEADDDAIGTIASEQTVFLARRAESRAPWLALCDSTGFGEAVIGELRFGQEAVIVARPGEAFEEIDAAEYRLAGTPAEFRLLLAAAGPVRGIIYLWGLDNDDASPSLAALDQAARIGCGGLLHLIQAVLERDETTPLWIVTRGAQAVNAPRREWESVPGFIPSLVWGMARAAREEEPQLRLMCLDLDPRPCATEIGQFCAELRSRDHETEVAFRRRTATWPDWSSCPGQQAGRTVSNCPRRRTSDWNGPSRVAWTT